MDCVCSDMKYHISDACASAACVRLDKKSHHCCVDTANICSKLSSSCDLAKVSCQEAPEQEAMAPTDACSRNFQDTCTCENALDHLDSISDACASGERDCSDVKCHRHRVDATTASSELSSDCDFDRSPLL